MLPILRVDEYIDLKLCRIRKIQTFLTFQIIIYNWYLMNITRVDTKEELDKSHVDSDSTVIVIDTCMFSSTIICLFDCGVEKVNVFREWQDTCYPFGGEGDGNFKFDNYPQSVYGVQQDLGKEVGITSDNGAMACFKVRQFSESCDLLLGSCLNMKYLVNKVKDNFSDNIVIVQSGSHNNFQLEDSITSGLISQYLRGVDNQNINLFEEHLEEFVGSYYPWVPKTDLNRLSDFNSYKLLPFESEYTRNDLTFIPYE